MAKKVIMKKEEVIKRVVDYFRSEHWQNFLKILNNPPEEIYHAHFWMENGIEANSLTKLMDRYLKEIGWEVDRKIDLMSGPGGPPGLHGVHPWGGREDWTLTFDMFWHFNGEAILAPSPPERGEMGKSFLYWGKSYMDEYYKQFHFKAVGPKEEREISKYFKSRHWKYLLSQIGNAQNYKITHMHANFEINFEPTILKLYALDALKAAGFQADWAVPCVFHLAEGYRAKIVFLMNYPEEIWDIAWKYNENVVIRPATETFIFDTVHPGYDISYHDMLDEVLSKDPYVKLEDEDINTVIRQIV
jgi:hypothetical protein